MSIDFSDGSGMNLMDIFEKCWIKEIAELYKEDVTCKLGDPKPTLQVRCIILHCHYVFIIRLPCDKLCIHTLSIVK